MVEFWNLFGCCCSDECNLRSEMLRTNAVHNAISDWRLARGSANPFHIESETRLQSHLSRIHVQERGQLQDDSELDLFEWQWKTRFTE